MAEIAWGLPSPFAAQGKLSALAHHVRAASSGDAGRRRTEDETSGLISFHSRGDRM